MKDLSDAERNNMKNMDNRLNVFQKWVILDFFWHGMPAARLSAERACRIGRRGCGRLFSLLEAGSVSVELILFPGG
jgi:hypothetical protein